MGGHTGQSRGRPPRRNLWCWGLSEYIDIRNNLVSISISTVRRIEICKNPQMLTIWVCLYCYGFQILFERQIKICNNRSDFSFITVHRTGIDNCATKPLTLLMNGPPSPWKSQVYGDNSPSCGGCCYIVRVYLNIKLLAAGHHRHHHHQQLS